MSCNCSGDRFFTRPASDEGTRANCCTDNRANEIVAGNFDQTRGCGCGYYGCKCNAKPVIKGCCTGGVAGATLKDGLCQFVNRKVLIRVGCQTLCVVIAEVCDCVLKAICPKTGKVLYFNLDRIVDVQDIYS